MPIECNPRTHSAITAFYNSECVADSYVISRGYQSSRTLLPKIGGQRNLLAISRIVGLFKMSFV